MSDARIINVTMPTVADLDRLGREIMRAIRRTEPPATGARNRWEKEWESLTRTPWREWVRRQQPKRLRVLLAGRPHDSRVWLDDREVHGLIAGVTIEQRAGGDGELTLRIPLALVELL